MDDRARLDYNTGKAGDEGGVEQGRLLAKGNLIEWWVAEEVGERPPAAPSADAAPLSGYAWRRSWGVATLVLLVLLAVGGWLWHQAHVGLNRIEGELQQAVLADEWQSAHSAKVETTASRISAGSAFPQVQPVSANLQSHLIKLGDDWAIVQVTLSKDGVLYRQTRLYHKGARGWLQDAPRAALWGAPRTLESSHFVFHYYALDGEAVDAAAAKLDALYPGLVASYSLDLSAENKRQIWVSPELSWQDPIHRLRGDVLLESSPAIYLAPIQLSDGDILAQTIFLDLLTLYSDRYIKQHFAAGKDNTQAMPLVMTLMKGLRLWQIWSSPLPLTLLFKPTVQWLYSDRQGERSPLVLDAKLCPLHQLWSTAPNTIQIPVFCGDQAQIEQYEVGRYFPIPSARSLAAIHLFRPALTDELYSSSTETEWVGLATLFDYAAAVYGQQSPAALVANAATYKSWEELIPATFGVAAPEFEKAWLDYLRDQYGVAVTNNP